MKRQGVMIAVEVYTEPPGASADRFAHELPDLVHLVAHELVHFQQAVSDLESYRTSNSLLARAIKEGSADYVAEMVSGDHINGRAHGFGADHEWELWRRFRCEMEGPGTGDWFFTDPEPEGWPQDLGYFVGYRIAQAYRETRSDAKAALRDVIRVTDYPAFLEASGYEARLEAREGRSFPACDA